MRGSGGEKLRSQGFCDSPNQDPTSWLMKMLLPRAIIPLLTGRVFTGLTGAKLKGAPPMRNSNRPRPIHPLTLADFERRFPDDDACAS